MYIKLRIFIVFLICVFNHCSGNTICESECICRHNTKKDIETIGEYVDCSYRPNILKSDYNLTKTIHSLDLSMNNLTVIESSNLLRSKSMQDLLLNNNKIKELNDVFELPDLKILDLSNNLLASIHEDTFKGVKQLEHLNLANNKFTTFDRLAFHHLSNLKEIILDDNNIGKSLREVNLFDRKGFGLTHKITSISIRGVNLNVVPDNFFIDAYDLRKLVISNNNLSVIFEIPFTLEYLDLSDNPIPTISEEDFIDLPALKELKLNNLWIKEVPDFAFFSLRGLVSLELEWNRNLTSFSALAFGREVLEDPDEFALETLSLKGSKLRTLDELLSEPFGQLIKLDVQQNPWNCDCHLSWLKKLQIQPSDYEKLRCATPSPLHNKKLMEIDDKYIVCPLQKHIIGISIAVISLCVTLTTMALWIFVVYPKCHKSHLLMNLHGSSTAYSVLPLSVRDEFYVRT